MILPDDTAPTSPIKSRADPPSEAPQEDVNPPPPPYAGRSEPPLPPVSQPSPSYGAVPQVQHPNALHQPVPYVVYRSVDVEAQIPGARSPLLPPPQPPQPHLPQVRYRRGERASTRFCKAFCIAIFIYFSVVWFVRTMVARSHSGLNMEIPDDGIPDLPHTQFPMPSRKDGTVKRCFPEWTLSFAPTYKTAEHFGAFSLHLPLSADVLYIFGRGSLSHGSIAFVPSEDPSIPEGQVRVNIVPRFQSSTALALTNICLLERAKGQQGIAILTPSHWHAEDGEFRVEVLFPVAHGLITHVKAFETNLPRFTHDISSSMAHRVKFGSISLYSQNARIAGGFIDAEEASIVTTDAGISGDFNVTRALRLETANANIEARVMMLNDPTQPAPAFMSAKSQNGVVHSVLNLLSTTGTGGTFNVSASTTNAPLELSVNTLPPDSGLFLHGTSINAPVSATLPPTYEGTYELRSSARAPLAVERHKQATDPMGQGRKRVWTTIEGSPAHVVGAVRWGDERGSGRASLRTSNKPVTLHV